MTGDRDVYEPGFWTRFRWFCLIMAAIWVLILIAGAFGAFD